MWNIHAVLIVKNKIAGKILFFVHCCVVYVLNDI
jgi:hypothetical protein